MELSREGSVKHSMGRIYDPSTSLLQSKKQDLEWLKLGIAARYILEQNNVQHLLLISFQIMFHSALKLKLFLSILFTDFRSRFQTGYF